MPAYAIGRVVKIHAGGCTKAQHHNERQKKQYKSNPDIQKELSDRNYHLLKPTDSYRNMYKKRLEETGCKERKNSVVLLEVVVTSSPEYMKELRDSGKERLYFEKAQEFLDQEYGKANAISAVVHLDEKTPHMHAVYVPVTYDQEKQKYRLSARDLVGNRAKLRSWQDRYYAHMKQTFPDIERGIPKEITGREHIETNLFKQAGDIEKFINAFAVACRELTPFNYKKKRDELTKAFMNEATFKKFVSVNGALAYKDKEKKELKNDIQICKDRINDLLGKNDSLSADKFQLERIIGQYEANQEYFKALLSNIPREYVVAARKYLDETRNARVRSRGRER